MTDAAEAIRDGGFRDQTGSYLMSGATLTGVFLSDAPVDSNEGAKGGQLLEVVLLDAVDLAEFEIVEEGKPYREWCVPAALINGHGAVRLLSDDEAEQAWADRFSD